ncbi:hypothetical protein CO112_01440 [Candidatus Dojkabacteria bacterium CG_4_9_14_3_um_filter_150_Dojkabacteria_WS6_41_13]|uniref:Uncharacterized protein n=1 Tax=Candidatus Dojkabacteria bacterium CG_4_10_14_0_2_um_filter_Dojkabacteria_WS6_41_15 TaxID=2014249 RepID=A0A2M7W1R8_9BACT|nr:MAG: hypothetical protein COX64_03060 [Candidatus Dojkabacteria bacterium CG_4_10_14_0_2_um_filter_Dojkabacteria_WS6_41_15]PJB23114.1 MAG: hypothetical protein CO112_01440 [Candidatus Dojkabacteria bacterium CG_4_9_14_3_um_filter_150_Dojkabacteria_WS6_41_13]
MSNPILALFSKLHSVTNTRYVNNFVTVKQEFEVKNYSTLDEKQQIIFSSLTNIVDTLLSLKEKYPQLQELNETIFININDLNNFGLTVVLDQGKGTVTSGWSATTTPTFIIPLFTKNMLNLGQLVSDNNVSMQEAYRILRVLFVPFLRGLYQGQYVNLPKDKSYLLLDNFLQVEIKDEFSQQIEGFPGNPRATVVNVDGQWLVFEGFQGDPDTRYSMNIEDAFMFGYLIRVKLVNSSIAEMPKYVTAYTDLKRKVTVYERKWHNVDEAPEEKILKPQG